MGRRCRPLRSVAGRKPENALAAGGCVGNASTDAPCGDPWRGQPPLPHLQDSPMRKYYLLAGLALSLALPATARAFGPFGPQKSDQYGFRKPLIGPRAAPWFVYWPYSAYFNTPAPTGAAFGPEAMTPGGFQP